MYHIGLDVHMCAEQIYRAGKPNLLFSKQSGDSLSNACVDGG